MLQTLGSPHISVRNPILPSDIREALLDDDSPFGLQGLARETLHILRSDRIGRLAAELALRGTPDQIRDRKFVGRILARYPDWQEEYRVIHLIEKSLWIDGHSDLVMTLTKNPSRILDNPPPKILQALSRAIEVHPQSTVWYGVPLFGEELNQDGLPIPLTASQVREEAEQRIATAQRNALRWGWAYRAAFRAACIPPAMWQFGRRFAWRLYEGVQACRKYWKRAKRDVRNRNRAKIVAQSEFCRMGESFTRIPEHTTVLGRMAEQTVDSLVRAQEYVADRVPGMEGMAPIMTGVAPVLLETAFFTSVAPLMIAPMTIIACDPFLFVELPDEPDKLRFLGHWYWQGPARGKRKLHLHV